jgi:histidine ammonia-lyase
LSDLNFSIRQGIELLAACQAIDLRRPNKLSPSLEKVHSLVRSHVTFMAHDRFLADDIDAVTLLIQSGAIWDAVKDHVESYEE